MDDELNDNANVAGEFRRKRPVPVPLYDNRYIEDRYIERPYLKKVELAKIRDNLDELVEIKEEQFNKNAGKVNDKPKADNIVDFKPNITVPTTSLPVSDVPKSEIVKDEVKLGISNLAYNIEKKKIDVVDVVDNVIENTKNIKQIVDKQIIDKKTVDKQTEDKNKKRKVNKMNDEENINISHELRSQLREAEYEKFSNKKETDKAIRESAELARQNKIELEKLKQRLAEENAEIKKELKNEFGNKINELSGKFNDITGKFGSVNEKFDGVSKKLEETCTGIDCLKKDFANISKNMDLFECENCGEKAVPALASYCPKCSSKQKWFEDDGVTPLKGWKPTWEKQ